ncbi:MAG: VTC domain-containing protein, partial [Planctomycetota bacterium]
MSISLLDDGASRSDLVMRREVKYVFTQHDVATLRRILLRCCRPIRYAGPVSTVRSIYFDDPELGACRANLDGIGLRHKTRLRWYDREQPPDRFFLETIWRRHRLCGKRRLHLASYVSPADVPFRTLHAGLCERLPDSHRARVAQDTEPIVLVEYRREHFALCHGDARLTLDYDIRFY